MTVELPKAKADSGAAAAAPAAGNWHVYTCDGHRFGPITQDELDRWAAEKRLTSNCQVFQDGWPAWRMAPELYPHLPAATPGMSGAAPNAGQWASNVPSQNPYAAPQLAGAAAYQVPHRGTLILVFGILGWAICGLFAIPAWIMGHSDLQKMKAGVMDNSGHGMTMAGMVLGMIQCILMAIAILILIAALAFTAFGNG